MLAREQFSTATAWGLDKAISLKLTIPCGIRSLNLGSESFFYV